MNALFEATVNVLSDAVSKQALELSLSEGLQKLGKDAETAGLRDIEKVLKSNIYHTLQLNLPASTAKTRVQQALRHITDLQVKEPEADVATQVREQAAVVRLEEGLKRFNLYFEWPEVQKFRSQLQVIRQQHSVGNKVEQVITDAVAQLEALDRRLQDLLVRQAREIAELQADLDRVRSAGGPKVRRLESLITQIAEAQSASTLAPAELERARKLAGDLRKMMESSVVKSPIEEEPLTVEEPLPVPPSGTGEFLLEVEYAESDTEFDLDFTHLEPEQAERVRDIDIKRETRQLEDLEEKYRTVLNASADLGVALAELKHRNDARELAGKDIEHLNHTLESRQAALLEEQRNRMQELQNTLTRFEEAGIDTGELRMMLTISEGVLGSGVVTDDMVSLEDASRTLERQYAERQEVSTEAEAKSARQLARQTSVVTEMRAVIESLSVLGQEKIEPFRNRVDELETISNAGELNEALLQSLAQDAQALQQEYEQRALKDANDAEAREQHEAEVLVQRQRDLAILRGHQMALTTLPDTPELGEALSTVQARLSAAVFSLEQNSVGDDLSELQNLILGLRQDYSKHYAGRLESLETQVRDYRAVELLDAVAQARAELETGRIPDVSGIETELRGKREVRLNEQRRELSELETTMREYAHLPLASALLKELAQARAGHESGQLIDLASVWTGMGALRAAEDAALIDWRNRVDVLMLETMPYREFGGETTTRLLRLLDVLANERQLESVSPQTRKTLETTVSEAESLAATVRDEYSAAQSVAAALNNSEIENLLGVFGNTNLTPAKTETKTTPTQAAASQSALHVGSGRTLTNDFKHWLEAITKERGVARVLVMNDGELEFGALENPNQMANLLEQTERYHNEFAEELNRQAPWLHSTEFAGGTLIVLNLRPESGYKRTILIELQDQTVYNRIYTQASRDYVQLVNWAAV